MMKIKKDMTMGEIVNNYPESVEVMEKEGPHCPTCPMAQMETLEAGARAHGLDPDKLVKKLNEKVEKD